MQNSWHNIQIVFTFRNINLFIMQIDSKQMGKLNFKKQHVFADIVKVYDIKPTSNCAHVIRSVRNPFNSIVSTGIHILMAILDQWDPHVGRS